MLHKVNLPGCFPQLERIVAFQREVLQYACEGKYHLPLDEVGIKALFNDERGEWLWKQMRTKPKRGNERDSDFNKYLTNLIAYYQKNQQEGEDALKAFDNDIQFADKIDDADFRFLYNKLGKQNKELIEPLMVSFYEDLLKSGFIKAIQGEAKRFNRDAFIASFWDNNVGIYVCPSCDRERSDEINRKVFDDADHFLPKSKYPFLSLHPYNLFPLCTQCNRLFKLNKDMVDDHEKAPLPHIFHPYKRTAAEKLNLIVYRDNRLGVAKLGDFIDKDGMPSRRMDNLNRVFRLNERWVRRLEVQKKNMVEFIQGERDRLRDRGHQNYLNDNELRKILIGEQQRTVKNFGKTPGFIVQNSYLNCTLNDADEFEELLKYFTN